MKALRLRSNASVMPFIITILILIGFGLYYLRHNSIQQEYFRDRNLRQLKLIGEQFESRLNNLKRVLRNTPRAAVSKHTFQPRQYLESVKFRNVDSTLAILPEGLSSKLTASAKGASVIFLQEREDTIWLQFADVDPGRRNGWDEIAGRMDIRDVVTPLLVENVFDEFLLLESSGRVVYQNGDTDIRVHCIDSLTDVAGTSFGIQDLQEIPGVFNPVLAGKEYRLFFQPLSVPILEADTADALPECRTVWTLCGLVLSERFNRETRELSYTILMFTVMFVLLASLSWPLLKLWFMGREDHATRADLYLIVLALMLGSGLLTFVVIDAVWVQGGFRGIIDDQLEEYASSVDSKFTTELDRALGQLSHYIAVGASVNPATDTGPTSGLLEAGGVREPRVYKTFDLVYWVDADGWQTMKWSTKKFVTERINVSERKYFTDVQQEQLLYAPDSGGGEYRFAVEPHHSWTSGVFRVAVSMPDTSRLSRRFLVAMDMEAVSVAHSVNLPGYGFCIVDDSGKAIFHSRPERALRENLFDELDPDKGLRSLVFARSAGHVDARYWGVDHRLFVKPIRGMPWSVVVFREKTVLWTMNIQILTGALSLFGVYLVLPVLLILFLSRRKSETEAWVWPSEHHTHVYRQLTVMYAFTAAVLFCVQIIDDHLLHALGSILILSLLVIVLTYLRLTKTFSPWFDHLSKQGRTVLAARILFLGVGVFCLVLIRDSHEQGDDWGAMLLHVAFDICLFGLGVAFLVKPFGGRFYQSLTSGRYRINYVTAHVAFIVLASIVPAIIFFRMSYNVHAELFVKHAQLQLARAFHTKTSSQQGQKSVYAGFFFDTRLGLPDSSHKQEGLDDIGRNRLFDVLIAPYNQSSLEMRNLLSSTSNDSAMVWSSAGDSLTACIRLPGAGQSLILASRLPKFKDMHLLSFFGFILLVLVVGVLVLIFIVVRDISRKLFLIDVRTPQRLDLATRLRRPLTSSHLLIDVSLDYVVKALGGREYIIDLTRDSWDQIWQRCDTISGVPQERVVVVNHCEHRMHESAMNRKKIKLLESLMLVYQRNVIVCSTVDPLTEFNLIPHGHDRAEGINDLASRWRTIIDMCLRTPHKDVPDNGDDPLGADLHSAGPYSRRVWHTCSEGERGVLIHVARGRFVSPRSHDIVRSLLDRGLLERKPVLRVSSKQFKSFLAMDEREREMQQYRVDRVTSSWNVWKIPLMVLLVAAAAFLFITQQDVLNWTMAFVSAATALLPALFRLFGMIRTGRATEEGNS